MLWKDYFNLQQCKELGVFSNGKISKYSANSKITATLKEWQKQWKEKEKIKEEEKFECNNIEQTLIILSTIEPLSKVKKEVEQIGIVETLKEPKKRDRTDYFRELNQDRKEYNRLKQQKYREKLKLKNGADNLGGADMVLTKQVDTFFAEKETTKGFEYRTNLLLVKKKKGKISLTSPEVFGCSKGNLNSNVDFLDNSFDFDKEINSLNIFAGDYGLEQQKTNKKDNHYLSRRVRDYIWEAKQFFKRNKFVDLGKEGKILMEDGKMKPWIIVSVFDETTKTLKWFKLVYEDYGALAQTKEWRQNFRGDKNSEHYQHLLEVGREIMMEYNQALLFSYLFKKSQHKFSYLRPLYFKREVMKLKFKAEVVAPKSYELVRTCKDPNAENNYLCQKSKCKGNGKNPHKYWDHRKKRWIINDWGNKTFDSQGITELSNAGEYFGFNAKFRKSFDIDKPKRENFEAERDYLLAMTIWNKIILPLIDFMVNELKIVYLVRTRSGGYHLSFRPSKNVSEGKLKELWDAIQYLIKKLTGTNYKLGDPKGLNGENSFLVSGLCEGYEIEFTKHFNYKDETKNNPIHFWNDAGVDKLIHQVKNKVQRLCLKIGFRKNKQKKQTNRHRSLSNWENKAKTTNCPPLLSINFTEKRTDFVAKLIDIQEDYLCLKGNNTKGDFAHKLRLEIEGVKADYFINSHHRDKVFERLKNISLGKEFQLTILKGKSLNWIDKIN